MDVVKPKEPYWRDCPWSGRPTEMAHIRPGGWVEVIVGEGEVSIEGEARNLVWGRVESIDGDKIYMRVADEVQDEHLTGIRNGDLLELEITDIVNSEYAPEQQQREVDHGLLLIEHEILAKHRREFEERYPECSREAMHRWNCALNEATTDEERLWAADRWERFIEHWFQARRAFVNLLIARERA